MKSSCIGTNTVNRKIKQYIYSRYPSNIHIINYTQSNNSWSKRICCINFKVVILYIYSQIIKPINIYCTVHILSVNQFSLFLVYFLAMKAATSPNPEILGTGCVYTNQNQLMISIFPRFFSYCDWRIFCLLFFDCAGQRPIIFIQFTTWNQPTKLT